MKYRCQKCKKRFTSEYLLNKHTNKTISCDIILKCDKCEKKFETSFLLNRHLSRKTPCNNSIEDIVSNNTILLQIEEAKIEQEREKTKREMEKNRIELEKLKLKKEIIETQSKLKQKEIELRREKNIEIEQVKSLRKEKTSTIINNNYTNNISIEATNYINNTFNANLVVNSDGFENKESEYLNKRLQMPDERHRIYQKAKSIPELISEIFRIAFNNTHSPETMYFIYDKESDKFFVARKESGRYEITNFDNIKKDLENLATNSCEIFKKSIKSPIEPSSKDHNLCLYIDRKNLSLENPAKIGLDHKNPYIKENMFGGEFSDEE